MCCKNDNKQVSQDYESMLAVEVLLNYLDTTAVSPLQAAFVQRAEPLASDVSWLLCLRSLLSRTSGDSVNERPVDLLRENQAQRNSNGAC